MLAVSNGESRRAFALVDALQEREITASEFADGIRSLTSEALAVTAAILSLRSAATYELMPRVWSARLLCRQLADATRILN